MSMPGWYPDPAGNPGRFRYWDGTAWSEQTTGDPAATPPPGASGSPVGGFGRNNQGNGRGRGALIAAIAALLVIALAVWALFLRGGSSFQSVPEDTNSASPTGPVWNESDTPTPTPSGSSEPAPSGGSMVDCPTGGVAARAAQDGKLTGGGLSVPAVDGWDDGSIFMLPWTTDLAAQTSVVATSSGPGAHSWFSVVSVGALSKADGFTAPRTAAGMMMSCFATSDYYTDYTGRKDVTSEAVTVGGKPGWHLRTEVYVAMPDMPQIPGDVIDVVVVDTGNAEQLGTFVSSATIGDTARQAAVDKARSELALA